MNVAILLILGAYAILDATAPRGVPFWAPAYAAVFFGLGSMLVLAMLGRREPRVPLPLYARLVVWLVVGLLFFLPAALEPKMYWNYMAADFIAMVAFPVLFVLLGVLVPELYAARRSLIVLTAIFSFAAVIAPFTTHFWGEEFARGFGDGRYDAPHAVFMAALWVLLLTERKSALKQALLIAAVVVPILGLFSQVRTALILYFLCAGASAFVVIGVSKAAARTLVAVVLFALVGSAVVAAVDQSQLRSIGDQAATRTRYDRFGSADLSILRRIWEAADVVGKMTDDDRVLPVVVGYGHGATFEPVRAEPERNVNDGRVHVIHVGPFLMLHRYGLIGVAGYLILLIAIGRTLFRLRREKVTLPPDQLRWQLFVTVAMLALAAEFNVRNVQNQPIASFVLGGFILVYGGYLTIGNTTSLRRRIRFEPKLRTL